MEKRHFDGLRLPAYSSRGMPPLPPTSLVFEQHVYSTELGMRLLDCLREFQPGMSAEALLRLDFQVEEDLELPAVWLNGSVLNTIWNLRQFSTKVRQYLVRSQLEAEINLLRETRFADAATKIEELASNIFVQN